MKVNVASVGSKFLRQPRRLIPACWTALRARHPGATTAAGVGTFPWLVLMDSQTQPQSSQSRHFIGRSWHFRCLEPTGRSAVSSPCRAIPTPLGPAVSSPTHLETTSGFRAPVPTATEKRAPCSGNRTVSSKPRPFNNVFRTRRSACSKLERGQSHCFSDRGKSGKPGGAPLDGIFSLMIARPVQPRGPGFLLAQPWGLDARYCHRRFPVPQWWQG
jgi:hypothetical protein